MIQMISDCQQIENFSSDAPACWRKCRLGFVNPQIFPIQSKRKK